MIDRKNKRASNRGVEVNGLEHNFFLEPAQVEIGSGYTVKINYDESDKPVLDIKTYGEVDTVWLQKELRRIFPKIQTQRLKKATLGNVVTVTRKGPSSKKTD
jgi:hypothetical protein